MPSGGADIGWIDERRDAVGGSRLFIGELMPAGYPAYLRIMHPAQRSDGDVVEDVSWQKVADANGRTLNALSRFEDLVPPLSASDLELARPLQGQLADRLCGRLAALLGEHTATPSECTFMFARSWGSLVPSDDGVTIVQLSDGPYIMADGTCSKACACTVNPTLWWPADKSWIVVTQVDMNSTLIGCDRLAMQAILADPDIEAWEVSRADPI